MATSLIEFAVLIVLTVPVTAALCRFRLAHRRRVSYGTVVVSALIVAVTWFLCLFPFKFSYNSHHDAQHMWDPNWLLSLLRLSGFIAVICLIPALVVVTRYQKHFSGGQGSEGTGNSPSTSA
jgi:hypothetical protein